MKIFLRSVVVLSGVLLITTQNIFSQCTPLPIINFINPSFEGTPQAGVTPGPWSICMAGQTPDTQPGSWGVTLPPTNGNSYLGLVHEPSASWQEGAAEQLGSPLTAGVGYTFTIDLANSSTTGGGIVPGCAECQVWGGFGACDDNTGTGVLLWSSGNISPFDTWMTYTVSFTPTQNFTWIMFRVNSLGCNPIATDEPYILLDNIGPILPGNVSITTIVNQNVTCAGLSNGQATVHAYGQNPPFIYNWNSTPVQTDSVLDNVPAGNYSITVTDANTCTATATITITQPQPIVLTPTVINSTCGNTGSAYMSYAGGTQPFTFLWSNNVTTQNNGNLFAGTYRITATDANACTATASITITQTASLTVSGVVTNPSCNVGGSIAASASGGTPNYTYSWNTTPSQNTAIATNLSGGTYTVTATDANSCTATASFIVTPPPNIPSVAITPTNVTCFGQSNGSAAANASGGTPGYTYSWNTIPVQTATNATNLAAGTYSVTVTDANSCTATANTTISQPTALTATTAKTDVLCYGQNTGSATATPGGGTAGYTYNWNTAPIQTTPSATNLSAGTYTVTLKDANNCTVTSSAIINQPLSALALSQTHTDVTCNGGNNGSANVSATGGTSRYTYSWNTTPVQTNSTASTLTAGSYTVTVTDANSCTASVSSVISQPATPVSVSATISSPTCFGQPLASATANATGGTGGYAYLWNTTPTQNTQTVSNIPPGNYTVVATDANNCTATTSITINPPPTQLVLLTSHTDDLCFGDASGSATVNASGSYGGYSYNWNSNPAQTVATAQQLTAGNYSVTVTDVQGCTATASETVSQPAAPLSLSTTKTDVLCFGNATGDATVIASGGTSGYNYIWSTTPQQTTSSVNSLIAGNYSVTVNDANGCSQTASETINEPSPLTATFSSVNVSCNGANNGSITLTGSGGVSAYSYQWSTTPSINSANAIGLSPGSYSVTITDANSCTISISNMNITEPTALALDTTVVDVSCPGHGDGSISVIASGGTTPYSYNWNNGNTSSVNSNLSGGTYTVNVTDNNSCAISMNVFVAELPGVALNGIVTDIPCANVRIGSVDITATSSFPPLQYNWSTGSANEDLASLDSGTYSVTVTDAHGCKADSTFHVGNGNIFSIDATPDTATINLGETVDINVAAIGSFLGNVAWNPNFWLSCIDCTTPVSSAVESITYRVTGTDVNGCIASDTVRVNVIPKYVVYIPNAFTPNGDGTNDFFEVFGNKEVWKQFEVKVFDRWGEKIYENTDMNFKWDGTYKDRLVNPSVLVYLVKVVYINNYTEKLYTGTVTLIR